MNDFKTKLLTTKRFKDSLNRYNGIDLVVINRVVELLRKAEADSNLWHFNEEKLKDESFGEIKAFKTAVTSGDRLIYVVEKQKLILVDVGTHDVMNQYAKTSKKTKIEDLRSATEPDIWFKKILHEVVLQKNGRAKSLKNSNSQQLDISQILNEEKNGEEFRFQFLEELDDKWVHFLDEEQSKISGEIFDLVLQPSDSMSINFVLGGPGTGKTVVLLNLANKLEKFGRSISFQLSKPVFKYLNSGPTKIPGVNFGPGPGVVVLIDDPIDSDHLSDLIRKARSAKVNSVVIALDPLQWHEKAMPENFEKIFANYNAKIYTLINCYRQSKGVAEKSMEITRQLFANNSRFILKEKQQIEKDNLAPFIKLSLGMQFVDDSGRYKIYTNEINNSIESEINRFREREFIWKHTNPIVFVYDEDYSDKAKKFAQGKAHGINRLDVNISRYQDIRGVEFQELFLFVSKNYWDSVTSGKKGLGSAEWERITCLHTILSRPKDGLCIFVE